MGTSSCYGNRNYFSGLEQIKETFWENAVQGTNGINPIESFDTSDYPTNYGGEIKGFKPCVKNIDIQSNRKMFAFTLQVQRGWHMKMLE